MPNEDITKGYETILVLTTEGETHSGFILAENEQQLRLGIADGKVLELSPAQIEQRRDMKASSMPEGLMKTVAAIEFLDLVAFLSDQMGIQKAVQNNWVWAEYSTEVPLRTAGDLVEVSRNGRLKLGPDFPGQWNVEGHLLLSPLAPKQFDFAFHSPEEVAQPEVTIDLQQVVEIRKLQVDNRQNRQFSRRASGLKLWISVDGQTWTEVWQAEQPELRWNIDLPEGVQAKYLKFGLPRVGTLHLYQVTAFGPATAGSQP